MMPNKMIANAISAVLAMGLAGTSTSLLADTGNQMSNNVKGMEKCYGIAKAGQNDCGTATHSCGAESKVDGDKSEWVFVPTGVCDKIVGGSKTSSSKS